jgi:serine protease Do
MTVARWLVFVLTTRVAVLAIAFATESVSVSASETSVDGYDVAVARQYMFREAVAVASKYVVRIDTIGGAQQRISSVDDEEPPAGFEDGSPPPEQRPFVDTLGSNFLVADGPTTGIVFDADGWILASSFNFVRDPAHITVEFGDGERYVADLAARDKVRKLALLKINVDGLDVPEWVPRSDIRVGQTAIALGRGYGGSVPSVTVGIVSALHRMLDNAIQTDAKLSPANYGGPLVGLDGRILGICVPMAQRPGELAGVEFYDAGIGFAIPFDRVEEIVRELKKGVSFYRGWLGVSINARGRGGCHIRSTADPSPVRDLGIRAGDIIVSANGHELRNITGLRQAIYMIPAGETVRLVIERNGYRFGYEVVLAKSAELGALVQDDVPYDPANPFKVPKRSPWKWGPGRK